MAPIIPRSGYTGDLGPSILQYFLLDGEMLRMYMILLPAAAYPFLPSPSRSGIRCEFFLLWPCILYFMLPSLASTLTSADAPPTLSGAARGQVLVFLVVAAASIKGLLVPRDREPTPKDFSSAASTAQGGLFFTLLEAFQDLRYYELRKTDSLLAAAPALFSFFGLVLVFLVAYCVLDIYLPPVAMCFVTRQFPGWYWLPENGAKDDFGPAWSMGLAVAAIAAPVTISAFIIFGW